MEDFLTKGIAWIERRRGTLLGVTGALVLGILLLYIGFWRTLLLVSLVVIGYTVGARYDAGERLWGRDSVRLMRRHRD